MSINLINYLSSGEGMQNVDFKRSNFAKRVYPKTSTQSFMYEETSLDTPVTAFGQRMQFSPSKPDALVTNMQLKMTVSALTTSSFTVDDFNYLRWKRHFGYECIERARFLASNEPVESIPGFWIYLQAMCYQEPGKRQRQEILNQPALTRDALSRAPITVWINLSFFCMRALGVHIAPFAMKEQWHIQVETRPLAECVESNVSTYTPVATLSEQKLIVEFARLPEAELKSYVDKAWRQTMKTMDLIERETITAASRHRSVINYKGFCEGLWIGLRDTNKAKASDTRCKVDHVDGLTISLLANGQPAIHNFPADYFRNATQSMRLPQRASPNDDYHWLYVPFALDSSKIGSSGGVDLNGINELVVELTFESAFTGDVTYVSPMRNVATQKNGKLVKRYG